MATYWEVKDLRADKLPYIVKYENCYEENGQIFDQRDRPVGLLYVSLEESYTEALDTWREAMNQRIVYARRSLAELSNALDEGPRIEEGEV